MKEPNLTVTIESSDDEYDGELLVDWRGKALTKTPKNKRRRSRSRSTNKNKKNTTPHTDQFDPQVCRDISPLLVVENSPEVSVTRQIFNTAEMPSAEGFTAPFISETPISAQLRAEPSKFCLKDTENMPFLPTLLNKCSGGGDVICLDSDNESDGHVSVDGEIIRKHRENERKHKQEEIARNKREKEVEKQRQKEEKRLKKEEEKMQKESAKTEAAEMRKREKEIKKWEKGKFALKSISAEIDTKVIERGLIAGHLLNRLAEKEFCFHVVSNQVQSSILWKINMPDVGAQPPFKEYDIPYILVVLEAEEFCNMVCEGSLYDHVCSIQRLYPGYSICYLTNKLMSFINKREQEQYKNLGTASCWRRPPIEQALANMVTHFVGVRSRLCLDEAEVADHIVGLTRSLAECLFRRKLTHLSISANGSFVPKDYPNKHMIKKSVWLKALIAIPRIPPKCAVAIAKKYPTMRSLLNVYLDTGRTVHEKEFLLQDIVTERLLGEGGRRLGPVCSKRVYRILMAETGNLKTDDVEEGADLFQP